MLRIRFLFIALFVSLLSQISLAAPVCEFKRINDVTYQGCTDFKFTKALESGNVDTVKQMLMANKDYVFACNQKEAHEEQLSSLSFAICHGQDESAIPSLVWMLLTNGAEATCESRNSKTTAMQCAQKLKDPIVRMEVIELLKAGGAHSNSIFGQ